MRCCALHESLRRDRGDLPVAVIRLAALLAELAEALDLEQETPHDQ